MIELRNLSHAFLKKTLFDGVNLRLPRRERYGVVGANGSGKSTFLKIIAGQIEADGGSVILEDGARMFRIGQDQSLNDAEKILDIAMKGKGDIFEALEKQEALLNESEDTPGHAEKIARLAEFIENSGGYRLKAETQTILEGLGIKKEFHNEPLSVLSGGYKWRVFLAQALVNRPDLLMLDEPTNHLDIVSIKWLEEFLCGYEGLVILVSHDRRFMDQVCTHILDIDFETITSFAGNYSSFEKARALFMLQKEREVMAKEREIAHKQAFVDRFRSKASKARQAQSRIKQIEKIVIEPIKKSSRVHPRLSFIAAERGPKEVLEVKDLCKSYGDKTILSDISFFVQRGQKLAVIGPNGAGKSTLIKALALEFPESASSVFWGSGVTLGYFPQDVAKKICADQKTALEWLWQFCGDQPQSFVQGLLGRVLLSGDDAKKPCKSLSGGELSRLYLAYLMMQKPNVLLLDEPTNHLDLESIESLTVALNQFEGTLIVVSHDRSFIEAVSDRVIEVLPNKVNIFLGSYSEFLEKSQGESPIKIATEKTASPPASYDEKKRKKARAGQLKKQLDAIMLDVEEKEARLKDLERVFLDDAFYQMNSHEVVLKLKNDCVELENSISELLNQWEAVGSELEKLEVP